MNKKALFAAAFFLCVISVAPLYAETNEEDMIKATMPDAEVSSPVQEVTNEKPVEVTPPMTETPLTDIPVPEVKPAEAPVAAVEPKKEEPKAEPVKPVVKPEAKPVVKAAAPVETKTETGKEFEKTEAVSTENTGQETADDNGEESKNVRRFSRTELAMIFSGSMMLISLILILYARKKGGM